MSVILPNRGPASSIVTDPWLLARERYLEDLTDKERLLFSNASLENLFYSASAAEKLHEAESQSRALTKRIKPLLDSLEQYGKALDVYSNASPTIMCPLWGSIRVLLHIAGEFGKYFDKLKDMFARIGDVLPRFRAYEKLFPDHLRLVNALSVVYVDIIEFCIAAKKVFRKGAKQSALGSFKLLWRPFERQFNEVLDSFRTHKENVEKEAGLAHMIEAAEARALDQRVRKEELRQRLLKQLSSINPEQKQRRLRKLRHADTGAWLIKTIEFADWLNAKKSTCLWCYGIPGCGKTVLTAGVLDHLATITVEGVGVAYHYCDFSEPNTLVASNILGCLIKQMLDRIEIPDAIAQQIDQYYKCGAMIPSNEELLTILLSTVAQFSEAYLILDGIDECEGQERAEVLSTVKRLTSYKSQPVKLFIVSRDDVHIRRCLTGYANIGISESSIESDISSYVCEIVKAKIRDGNLVVNDTALVGKIIEDLSRGARGMFLWVAFQLDELCEAASDCEIRQVLHDLPKDLSEMYGRILKRIRTSKRGSEKMAMARKIFEWVSCAKRPLLIDELKEAIAFGPTDHEWDADKIPTETSRLIQACGNLIIVAEDDHTVRLAHYTVLQFLTSDPIDPSISDFHFNTLQADLNAGETCVAYLSFADFETQLTKTTPSHALRDMQTLEAAFVNRTTYLQGFSKTVWHMWHRLRGSPVHGAELRIDFETVVNNKAKSTLSEVLQEKYRFLEYAIENWIWHTTRFEELTTTTWNRFRSLALESQKLFDFRPWGETLGAKDMSHLPLFRWAVESGHAALLSLLLAIGGDFSLTVYCAHEENCRESPMVSAARHGHVEVMKLLVKVMRPNIQRESLPSLLHMAIASGRSEAVEALFEIDGMNPNAKDSAGRSGLEVAVDKGCHDIVQLLLWKGANAAMPDTKGGIALHSASENGYEDIARLLLRGRGSHDLMVGNHRGNNALLLAARNGHAAIVRLLLAQGADVAAADRSRLSALSCACSNGHETVVRLLLEYRADMAATDKDGRSALHFACLNGHETVVKLLLAHRAGVDATDRDGRSALHLACLNRHETVVKLLLAHRAGVDATDRDGRSALHLACLNGHETVVKLLLAHRAGVDATDRIGWSALHLASSQGHETVVRLLIAGGADVAVTDSEGRFGCV